jgi:hypothetical protein
VFEDIEDLQPHDVASLLKLFFREVDDLVTGVPTLMPDSMQAKDPLIPRACYRPLIDASSRPDFAIEVQVRLIPDEILPIHSS